MKRKAHTKKKKKPHKGTFFFSLLPTPQLSIYRNREKEEKKKRRRTLSRERERRCIVNLSAPLFRGRKRELKGRERRTRWGRWVPRGLHEENLDALSKHNVPVRRTDPKNKKLLKKKKKKRNSVPSELSSFFSKTKPACGSRIILLLTRANVRRTARDRSRFGLQQGARVLTCAGSLRLNGKKKKCCGLCLAAGNVTRP